MNDERAAEIRAALERLFAGSTSPAGIQLHRDLVALHDERDRMRTALSKIASHTIDKRYWDDISDHAIAQDSEGAHDDLVAIALAALSEEGQGA